MICEANPIHPPIHVTVTWLLRLILIARGPVEAITGPFPPLTRCITTATSALRGFCLLIYRSICDGYALERSWCPVSLWPSCSTGREFCFSSSSKGSFCHYKDSKELGRRLAAPNVLGGVNGLCNVYKQVSGGRRLSLGNVISQGSSVTRERNWVWFGYKALFLNYEDDAKVVN